jgi:probable FeS assembly SUF system protein SufT
MTNQGPIALSRDVEATQVPSGTPVTLLRGEQATVVQALGGSYTVVVNGNMFRVDSRNADALGQDVTAAPGLTSAPGAPRTQEELEKEVWNLLKTVYDPEIPVNVVELGLIYHCALSPQADPGSYRADVKMTLTAPGCGMGPVLQQEVSSKLLSIEGIDEANVELVWDPPWNQGMLSEAARLQLGLY